MDEEVGVETGYKSITIVVLRLPVRGGFRVVFEEARVHVSARLNFDCVLESWSLGGRVHDAADGRTGRHLRPHTPEASSHGL